MFKFLFYLFIFYSLYQVFKIFIMPLLFNKVQKNFANQLKDMMNQQQGNYAKKEEGETTISNSQYTTRNYNN